MTDAPANTRVLVVLAFDYGTKRIGVATGNTLSRCATPLCTLECTHQRIPWNAIDKLVQDYSPAQLVVGLPMNDDGTATGMTAPAQAFADTLKERFHLPVALTDERHSSREAERELAWARSTGMKPKRVTHGDVDKVAAKVVLDRWFSQPR